MRTSAALIAAALLLVAIQIGFSDGTTPVIAALPIGMLPLTAGLLALVAGVVLGLVLGSKRYRLAMLLALFGTALALFAFTFMTIGGPGTRSGMSVNEIAFIGAVVSWLAALVLAVSALTTHESPCNA
jgi:hypothetical protein